MANPQRSAISTRKERVAWYFYDFGNSAYASVVLLAVFAVYFKSAIVGGARGTLLWGLAVGIAMLVVAAIAPILGTIADFFGSKKRFLLAFTIMACVFTALLFFTQKGDIVSAMVFFILAEIGYRSAQVFYDALLPEIARPEEMGRISGIGWAIGSAGGIASLVLILPMILLTGSNPLAIRLSLVVTALFYLVAAMPLFFIIRERAQPQKLQPGQSILTLGFKRLWTTFKAARRYREFIKFFVAFLVYNDGIIMMLDFAAIIGAVLFGMQQQALIPFFILVQATNVAGAYAFGRLADRTSSKRALFISLALLIGAVVWLRFNNSPIVYFVIGAVAGVGMAGAQAVSRSMVGAISPPGKSAEFYGFFALAGRTSSFIGPAIYGWLAATSATWYQAVGQDHVLAEQSGQRLAILAIAAFLVVGGLLLLSVNEKKARSAVSPQGSA
jgi:UMF1 family MFS transporter